MARINNAHRRKRKYDQARKNKTESNRKKRAAHQESLVKRTQALINERVWVRQKEGPKIGLVQEIIAQGDERYPKDSNRKGSYLGVQFDDGNKVTVSRSRIRKVNDSSKSTK